MLGYVFFGTAGEKEGSTYIWACLKTEYNQNGNLREHDDESLDPGNQGCTMFRQARVGAYGGMHTYIDT